MAHYKGARPHMALGTGAPDPPSATMRPSTQLSRHQISERLVCASNRYWTACITNICLRHEAVSRSCLPEIMEEITCVTGCSYGAESRASRTT